MSQGFDQNPQTLSKSAAGDLSSNQFYLVKDNGSDQVAVCTTKGERCLGILQNDPSAANRAASVLYAGVGQVECGGTFATGDAITTDASGKAIKATDPDDYIAAYAVEAGASGERASVLLVHAGSVAAADVAGGPQFEKVTLTNAEIKALRASPKTLIAAPGANKLAVIESIALELNAGSEVLTESVDNMVVEYSDGQDITAAIEATGFIDQAANTWAIYYPAAIAAAASATVGVNKAVQLTNTGDGEYGGNASADATMDVMVGYRIVDVS